jgi:hypothetical protein
MCDVVTTPRLAAMLIAAGSGLALAAAPATAFASSGHHQARHHDLKLNQVNLASDIPGMAPLTDPDLKNPWGISHSGPLPYGCPTRAPTAPRCTR